MLNYSYNVVGNGISKLLPIILGWYVSRYSSEGAYYQFVDLLIEGNLIVAFSVMGFGSQLLVTRDNVTEVKRMVLLAVILLVSISILNFLIQTIYFEASLLSQLGVVLFSVGLGLTSLMVFYLNGRFQYKSVFIFWVTFFVSSCVVIFLFSLSDWVFSIFFIYGLLFFVAGMFFFLTNYNKLFDGASSNNTFDGIGVIKIVKNAIFLSTSTVLYLLGFKLISSSIETNVAYSSIFALGYQVFAVVLFIPSISGSFFIPYLSDGRLSYLKGSVLLVYYIVLGLLQIGILTYFYEEIFSFYGISVQPLTGDIFSTFIYGAFIACMTVFFVQKFNATKMYDLIVIGTLIWFSVVFLFLVLSSFDLDTITAVKVILYAYILCLVYYLIMFFKRWERL